MRRREFIVGLGGAAAAWPFAATAQQPAMPVIGYISNGTPETGALNVAALRKGLSEVGYIEGRSVAFDFAWAGNGNDRQAGLAAELVRRRVSVIVTGGLAAPFAAKAATTTIPIVFVLGADPVKLGIVDSLARPGGNITGVNFLNREIEAKRLGLLHDVIPQAKTFAVLMNPKRLDATDQLNDVQQAAQALGIKIIEINASTESEIDGGFDNIARQRPDAFAVAADPFFSAQRERIIALATRQALPGIFSLRESAVAGGLISYSASITEAYRQVGIYVGRILKGAKPTDLPVLQSTKFELVINLKSAKTLGITIPPGVLAIADEVIE